MTFGRGEAVRRGLVAGPALRRGGRGGATGGVRAGDAYSGRLRAVEADLDAPGFHCLRLDEAVAKAFGQPTSQVAEAPEEPFALGFQQAAAFHHLSCASSGGRGTGPRASSIPSIPPGGNLP